MDSLPAEKKPAADLLLKVVHFQNQIAQAALDVGEIMNQAAKGAQSLLNAHGAVIELLETNQMVYRAAAGIAEKQLGMRISKEGSLSGACMDSEVPLYCEDSETDPRVNRVACRTVGLRSMIVVPLRYLATTVGVLKVLHCDRSAFSEDDVQILVLVSTIVASAMTHAGQYQSKVNESKLLLERATVDSLTGLNNRASFYDHLWLGLAQAHRRVTHFGVGVIDMDGLKWLNDTIGHDAGDAALRELSQRIKTGLRGSDIVARLGGDEFGLLLPDVRDRDAVQVIVSLLLVAIEGPFLFQGVEYPLRASVGISIFPEDGDDPEVLVRKADQVMYEMKRSRHAAR